MDRVVKVLAVIGAITVADFVRELVAATAEGFLEQMSNDKQPEQ